MRFASGLLPLPLDAGAQEIEVRVEAGAGVAAHQSDDEYREQGVVVTDAGDEDLWRQSDVVATIHPPSPAQLGMLRRGAALIDGVS